MRVDVFERVHAYQHSEVANSLFNVDTLGLGAEFTAG